MGKLTVVQNPFNPSDGRILGQVEAGCSLLELAKSYETDAFDLVIAVNGKVMHDHRYIVEAGDAVAVMAKVRGGGDDGAKGVLRMVAMIVVVAAATFITGGAAGMLGSTIGAGGFAASAAGAAFAMGGMMLVNAILPPAQPQLDGAGSLRSDGNTYGWGESTNQLNEGLSASVLYGKHRIVPQVIANYRNYEDGKDTLNVLMHLTEGESATVEEVKINDIDFADLTTDETASYVYRNGAINQATIAGFDDAIYEKSLNKELLEKDEEFEFSTDGNQVEKLSVGVTWANGLYAYRDGSYRSFISGYTIHYRAVGDVTWLPFSGMSDTVVESFNRKKSDLDQFIGTYQLQHGVLLTNSEAVPLKWKGNAFDSIEDDRVITTKTHTRAVEAFWSVGNSPDTLRIQHTHSSALTPDEYELKVTLLEKKEVASGSTSYSNRPFVSFLHEIIESNFTYPYRSIIGLEAIAQEKIYGGSPVISLVVDRGNLNHYAGDYGVGSPTLRASSNPAWACYDMLTNPLYGAGVDPTMIVLSEFQAWADFCDAESLTCNIYLDTGSTMFDALKTLSLLGRGSILQRGTNYGAVFDSTSPMVYVFGMGSILEGTFNMSYIEKESRANVVEVTYYDENLDWEKKIVTVRQDTEEDAPIEKKTSINLIGCSNRAMATSYAQFMLRSNEHLIRSVTFQADIEAVHCQVGDVIGVSHDVPQYGQSGRVMSATATTITLDKPVYVTSFNAQNIIIKNNQDEIETVQITNPVSSGEYSTLTVSGWTTQPSYMDVYTFGVNNSEIKEFRVLSIRKTQDMQVEIAALEYREEIYANEPTLPDYELESGLPSVFNLQAYKTFKVREDGTAVGTLEINWDGFSTEWKVNISRSDGYTESGWNTMVSRSSFEISGLAPQESMVYRILVRGLDGTSAATKIEFDIDVPDPVLNLTSKTIDQYVQLDWDTPASVVRIDRYEVWKGEQKMTTISGTFASFLEVGTGTNTYSVVAVNVLGGVSDPVYVDATITSDPNFESVGDAGVDGSGTLVDMVWDGTSLIGPVGDTTETWDEVWQRLYPVDYATKTWQDMASDFGFDSMMDVFAESGITAASYEQTFDFGIQYQNGLVRVDPQMKTVSGNEGATTVQTSIEYSADNVTFYGDINALYQNATGFRYVRVKFDLTSDGESSVSLTPVIAIDAKLMIESGKEDIDDTVLGTTIPFRKNFGDVFSINVTPKGTEILSPVVDFDDVPNPTDFTVWLYNQAGTSVTGDFSYEITGI